MLVLFSMFCRVLIGNGEVLVMMLIGVGIFVKVVMIVF